MVPGPWERGVLWMFCLCQSTLLVVLGHFVRFCVHPKDFWGGCGGVSEMKSESWTSQQVERYKFRQWFYIMSILQMIVVSSFLGPLRSLTIGLDCIYIPGMYFLLWSGPSMQLGVGWLVAPLPLCHHPTHRQFLPLLITVAHSIHSWVILSLTPSQSRQTG